MTIQELESAVSRLNPQELEEFSEWFEEFDAKRWDAQFEDDAKKGKLDSLADQALRELSDGKCTEL
jgi:hypothetical protein